MTPISRLALTAGLSATATASLAGTDGWDMLKAIEIEEIVSETQYEVRKSFPASMPAEGTEMELTGYAVPMTPGGDIRELLLVSDMGLCPFCGSGDHGASLQVTLAEPISAFEEGTRLTLKGTLKPVSDPETWQAAILENAVITGS